MSDKEQRTRFAERLRDASEDTALSGALRRQAAELARRLECGVTIAVLGPAGSGKTSLLEVFVGHVLPPVPEGCGLRLLHGPGQGLDDVSETAPETVAKSGMDGPLFDTVRILEVAGGETIDTHATRHQWAISHADIVLWCAQEFTAADQAIWSKAPDPLKDNSFLVMTRADTCAANGGLKAQLLNLQAVASEEFHSVFPTTVVQAQQVLKSEGNLPDAVLAASGVKALSAAVMKLVASGLQADLDAALLFLEKHGPARPFPQSQEQQEAQPLGGSYESALEKMRTRARAIAGHDTTSPDDFALDVLGHCEEMAEELLEMADQSQDTSESFEAWRSDLMEASDKIVLMGLEGGLPPALDAVTVLVQLARDAEIRLNP